MNDEERARRAIRLEGLERYGMRPNALRALRKEEVMREIRETREQMDATASQSQQMLDALAALVLASNAGELSATELREAMTDTILMFAPTAEKFLEDLITGRLAGASLALRAKYASLALARAGYGPLQKHAILTQRLSSDDIEAIKQRAALAQAATADAARSAAQGAPKETNQ